MGKLWFQDNGTAKANCNCMLTRYPNGFSLEQCDFHTMLPITLRKACESALAFIGDTKDPNDAAFAVAEELRKALGR